jgi:hypothetical protein
MTPDEHYKIAERLLAGLPAKEGYPDAYLDRIIAHAQAHATLACARHVTEQS